MPLDQFSAIPGRKASLYDVAPGGGFGYPGGLDQFQDYANQGETQADMLKRKGKPQAAPAAQAAPQQLPPPAVSPNGYDSGMSDSERVSRIEAAMGMAGPGGDPSNFTQYIQNGPYMTATNFKNGIASGGRTAQIGPGFDPAFAQLLAQQGSQDQLGLEQFKAQAGAANDAERNALLRFQVQEKYNPSSQLIDQMTSWQKANPGATMSQFNQQLANQQRMLQNISSATGGGGAPPTPGQMPTLNQGGWNLPTAGYGRRPQLPTPPSNAATPPTPKAPPAPGNVYANRAELIGQTGEFGDLFGNLDPTGKPMVKLNDALAKLAQMERAAQAGGGAFAQPNSAAIRQLLSSTFRGNEIHDAMNPTVGADIAGSLRSLFGRPQSDQQMGEALLRKIAGIEAKPYD